MMVLLFGLDIFSMFGMVFFVLGFVFVVVKVEMDVEVVVFYIW